MMLRNHHILPRAGGWDDQCALWADDINALNLRYNRLYAQLRPDSKRDDSGLDDLLNDDTIGDFGKRYGFTR